MSAPGSATSTIPGVLTARSRRVLAEAIDLVEATERLCRESHKLEMAVEVLTGGVGGEEDPDCKMAEAWNEITGQMLINRVLLAAAEKITTATSSIGSDLSDRTAGQLRREFAHVLEQP